MSRVKKMAWGLMIGAMWLGNVNGQTNYLPDIYPVSPQAATLGKYMDLPVDISTGRINYQIPFYKINEGGVEIPVYLSYNYSGLMTDEKNNTAGLGWNLQAGGIITRKINGLPDESPNGYLTGGGSLVYDYIKGNMEEEKKDNFISLVGIGGYDGEPDKFNLGVNGLKASFYINHNGKVVFFPESNLKLSYDYSNNSIHSFTLIDTMGNYYLFSEKDYIISVKSGSDVSETEYVSSWYLSKIISHSTKNEIIFEYDDNTVTQTTKSLSTKQYVEFTGPLQDNIIESTSYNTFHEKIINSISSVNQKIIFYYTDFKINNTSKSKRKFLTSMIANNQPGYKINFHKESDGRFIPLIENIVRKKDGKNEIYYSFEYEKGNLSSNSIYRDILGFSNPNKILSKSGIQPSVDFNSTKAGALKKITFPTKGYTNIKYEQNTVNKSSIIKQNIIKQQCNNSFSFGKAVTPNTSKTFISNPIDTNGKKRDQCDFTLSYSLLSNIEGSEIFLKLQQKDGTVVFERFLTVEPIEPDIDGKTKTVRKSAIYSRKESYHKNYGASVLQDLRSFSNADLEGLVAVIDFNIPYANNIVSRPTASAKISFDYSLKENAPLNHEIPYPGIRIKEFEICSKNDSCYIKKYEYKDAANNSSGLAFSQPNFWSHTNQMIGSSSAGYEFKKWINVASSSITPVASYSGSPVLYKYVQEYVQSKEGHNLGKTSYEFTRKYLPPPIIPYIDYPNFEWEQGKLIKRESFDSIGNILKQDFKVYDRKLNFVKQPEVYALKAIKTKFFTGVVAPEISHFVTGTFFLNSTSSSYLLAQKKMVSHFENHDFEENTSFKYSPNIIILNERKYSNSNGKTITKKFYYPDDVTSKTELPGGTLSDAEFQAIKQLQVQHRIAEVVQEVTEVTDTKGSATFLKRNNYANWGNNRILPKSAQTLKGTATSTGLEERAVFHRYDSSANPLEVSQKDGMHTVYLYGYSKQYPIAKIENATFSEVVRALGVSENALENFNETHIGQINGLRAKKSEWMITTYTHIPLVGVKTVTDPRGRRTTYEYDDFNRLKHIKDHNGDILEAYDYHYKNE